ncbi:DUF2142 domain-containing protein [Candidatus Dojkabacteria bacterium]|nr:DUF2142 domain-containing protein [Candidatus Dojkabacteria bacterium]
MEKPFKNLLVLFIVLGFLWVTIIPPFQVPDEQAHLRYVQFIAENLRIPNRSDIYDSNFLEDSPSIEKEIEVNQSNRVFHNWNYHFDFEKQSSTDVDSFNAAHVFNHPPAYYIIGAIFYAMFSGFGMMTVLFILRIVGVALSVASFIYSERASRFLTKNKYVRLAIVTVANFWPMYMFISSGVNNDVLLFTSSMASIYYVLKAFNRKELVLIDYVAASLWCVLGILSKAQFLIFVPIICFVFGIRIIKKFRWKEFVVFAVPMVIPLAYFIRNVILFKSLYPNPAGNTGIVRDNFVEYVDNCRNLPFFRYVEAAVFPRYKIVFQNFVGNFGWLDTLLPKYVYAIAAVVCIIAVLRFIYKTVRDFRSRKKDKNVIILVSLVVAFEAFLSYMFLRVFYTTCYTSFPTQGRYYFPILFPIAAILVVGLTSIVPTKFVKAICRILVCGMFLFNFFCVVLILTRYYL